jgi:hypothetical protein
MNAHTMRIHTYMRVALELSTRGCIRVCMCIYIYTCTHNVCTQQQRERKRERKDKERERKREREIDAYHNDIDQEKKEDDNFEDKSA